MVESYTIGENIAHFIGSVLFLLGLFFVYGFAKILINIYKGEIMDEEAKWKGVFLTGVLIIVVFWLSFWLLDYREYVPVDRLY